MPPGDRIPPGDLIPLPGERMGDSGPPVLFRFLPLRADVSPPTTATAGDFVMALTPPGELSPPLRGDPIPAVAPAVLVLAMALGEAMALSGERSVLRGVEGAWGLREVET